MYLWLWRELYHALEKATCAVFRHCSRREMASPNGIRLLKFLDSYIYDCFDDNDSDRDSDKELDGVDRVSEATEDYSAQTEDDLDSKTAWPC